MNKNIKCICGSYLQNPVNFSTNFFKSSCNSCSTEHFIPKDPNKGLFKYNESNDKYSNKKYLKGKVERWSHYELKKINWTNRKVLEIGCFNGFFLNELRVKGADVYGVDLNEEAISVGISLYDLKNRIFASIDECSKYGQFDDIIAIDLFEHVDDPSSLFDDLNFLLKEGGNIIIGGPTIERKFHDKSDYPPHHRWWFSIEGLSRFVNLKNYEVVNISKQSDIVLYLRNLVGKIINGYNKNEFYGSGIAIQLHEDKFIDKLYKKISRYISVLAKRFGFYYCSSIIIAKKLT